MRAILMPRPKITIAGLMVLTALTAVPLATYRYGRRAATPPPVPTVQITRTGTKYHAAGCRYLRAGSIEVPLDQVRATHRPCLVCAPPSPVLPP